MERRRHCRCPGGELRRTLALLRACECFALFCSMKGLQQVLVVVLRGLDGWSEGEPVGVE
jgi:hypothetical protein